MISLKAELYSTKCFETFYLSMLDAYLVLVQFLVLFLSCIFLYGDKIAAFLGLSVKMDVFIIIFTAEIQTLCPCDSLSFSW